MLAAAELVDESECFDSVWVGDNFLPKPRLEAVVSLAAIAARTKRVKLGVMCMATFVKRHPVPFAIQWASLDVLSGGRTIFVACLGGSGRISPRHASELSSVGVADSERIGRMVEGIQVLRALWGPGPVSYAGRFYRFDDIEALPKPHQARVPILIAANPPLEGDRATEERALRRVARWADGWATDSVPPSLGKGPRACGGRRARGRSD
jgi:alkanesulfonate monooxygenase SsuD/methylene tetrahydromethanopterin reductase-like flavin-dependent oxidoreductase (luciferase family)